MTNEKSQKVHQDLLAKSFHLDIHSKVPSNTPFHYFLKTFWTPNLLGPSCLFIFHFKSKQKLQLMYNIESSNASLKKLAPKISFTNINIRLVIQLLSRISLKRSQQEEVLKRYPTLPPIIRFNRNVATRFIQTTLLFNHLKVRGPL